MVTEALPLLLAGVGSVWSPVTLAESVSVPAAVGVTTRVAVKVFSEGIDGQVQVTGVVPVQLPPRSVTEAETRVELAGSTRVRMGFVPCDVAALKIRSEERRVGIVWRVLGLGEQYTLDTRRSI